jgi:hypothetical protein
MYSRRTMKALLAFLTALSSQLLLPHLAFSQAFLPFKGEGNYYISFQNFYTKEHFLPNGRRVDVGHIQENGLIQAVDFGLTHKMSVEVSLPYVFGKYNGLSPHVSPGNTTDNGHYHGTMSDFRFAVRYNLEMRPLAITPFIEGVIPSHNYEIYSHSAVGYGLREIRLGVSVGRTLNYRSAFQAQYAYGIVEKHLGVRPNRSTVRSQFQYFVTRRLFVSGLQGFQKSHGGIDFPDVFVKDWSNELWYRHAQVSNFSFLNFGVSAGYTLTRSGSVEVAGNYLTDVWGRNGHVLNRNLGISLIYNFRTRFYDERVTSATRKNCGVVCRKCQTIFRPLKRTPTAGR